MRAVGRLGWGEIDTNTPVTPAELNAAYPFGQKYFAAHELTLDGLDPAIRTDIQIGTLEKTFGVIKFLDGVNTECAFTWGLKDFQLDEVNPSFKIYPIWFQSQDAVDPNTNAVFEAYIQNKLIASSLNQGFDTGPSGTKMVSSTEDQWETAGGDPDSSENFIAPGISGDALSATGLNFLQFQIERHGADGSDNFIGDVYLLGLILQYKHKFQNVREWPVIP